MILLNFHYISLLHTHDSHENIFRQIKARQIPNFIENINTYYRT